MSVLEFIASSAVMLVAACLQGSAGLGMALLAAPLLLLVDPALVPAPIIVNGFVLVVSMAVRERKAIVAAEVSWAVLGAALGSAAAAVLLSRISSETFGLVFGIVLLAAVAISLFRFESKAGPRAMLGAGVLSGLMGTTTSIGGPPLALVLQNTHGAHLRATLSAYFIASSLLALGGLAFVGRFGLEELRLALFLLPGTIAGLMISNYTRQWLVPKYVRPAVLVLSTAAGVLILSRYFLQS